MCASVAGVLGLRRRADGGLAELGARLSRDPLPGLGDCGRHPARFRYEYQVHHREPQGGWRIRLRINVAVATQRCVHRFSVNHYAFAIGSQTIYSLEQDKGPTGNGVRSGRHKAVPRAACRAEADPGLTG